MTLRPPEGPRPRVTPLPEAESDAPLPPGVEERTRNIGHVSVRRAYRAEEALSVAERRRLRRLRRATDSNSLPPALVPRGLPFRIYVSTRWFSALIVVTLLVVLHLFLTRDVFFIRVIYVGGTRYLSSGEIFQRSGLANLHVFWVDPAQVEVTLELDPAVANAVVEVGWPPNMVNITISEREPALIWEQSGQRVWVDVRGRVMQLRQDLPNLVRVIVEKPSADLNRGPCPLQGMDEVLGPGSCIDSATVAGVLQFKALYPTVNELVYDPAKGLGYQDGRGWRLWFGDGSYIATKMAVYEKIVRQVYTEQGKQFVEVNVAYPDAPYYSLVPGRR